MLCISLRLNFRKHPILSIAKPIECSSTRMQRPITSYFGAPSPKKPKIAESSSESITLPKIHSSSESNTPSTSSISKIQADAVVSKPQNEASTSTANDGELSLEQLAAIDHNRKKALSKQLASKITEESWREALSAEFDKPYFLELADFLDSEKRKGATIYPAEKDFFNALNSCPLEKIKVVILGQDPYHQPGQAHGLSFSVLPPTKPPSSLRNIYKELHDDIPEFVAPKHGNLESWAQQGVLLLNACLSVRRDQPNSHEGKGWEKFTGACLSVVSEKLTSVVFLLWGAFAQKRASIINSKKHHLLKAVHPSGLSANKGFFGCKHFSKTNAYLTQIGKTPIQWQLPADGTPNNVK